VSATTALLVVDRRFVPAVEGVFTEGPVGPETGHRYLAWFDRVIVAGRRGSATASLRGLNRVSAPGLEVRYLPDLGGAGRRLRGLGAARRALAALFAEADVVIARLPAELGIEAADLAQQVGKPLALDVGGCVLDGLRAHGSIAGRLYAPVAYRRMRRVVGRAGWVAYVTQHFLQGRYPAGGAAQTVACPNVDLPAPDPGVLAARLARPAADPAVLTFGTIGSLYGAFKGIQHALAALAEAAPRLPPFRYRVLGGGDPEPWRRLAARHGLADRVSFDGVLPAGPAVHAWLDGIDVYLQPSLREGLPRALIEAMSRGCPVIASDLAGIPELLPPDRLHPPGDVRALARLLPVASTDADRRAQAARNWEVATRYAGDVLAPVRSRFWTAFRDSAGGSR
jgi:glycosyltransferase involved in cell wall biosynthesis